MSWITEFGVTGLLIAGIVYLLKIYITKPPVPVSNFAEEMIEKLTDQNNAMVKEYIESTSSLNLIVSDLKKAVDHIKGKDVVGRMHKAESAISSTMSRISKIEAAMVAKGFKGVDTGDFNYSGYIRGREHGIDL